MPAWTLRRSSARSRSRPARQTRQSMSSRRSRSGEGMHGCSSCTPRSAGGRSRRRWRARTCAEHDEFAIEPAVLLAREGERAEPARVEAGGHVVAWRHPDSRDVAAAAEERDAAAAERVLLSRCVLEASGPDGQALPGEALPPEVRAAVSAAMLAGRPARGGARRARLPRLRDGVHRRGGREHVRAGASWTHVPGGYFARCTRWQARTDGRRRRCWRSRSGDGTRTSRWSGRPRSEHVPVPGRGPRRRRAAHGETAVGGALRVSAGVGACRGGRGAGRAAAAPASSSGSAAVAGPPGADATDGCAARSPPGSARGPSARPHRGTSDRVAPRRGRGRRHAQRAERGAGTRSIARARGRCSSGRRGPARAGAAADGRRARARQSARFRRRSHLRSPIRGPRYASTSAASRCAPTSSRRRRRASESPSNRTNFPSPTTFAEGDARE